MRYHEANGIESARMLPNGGGETGDESKASGFTRVTRGWAACFAGQSGVRVDQTICRRGGVGLRQ
jgi:hypothetical protein